MTVTDKTRQPLVSFIVTCYNLPTDMLCECIDSILKLNLQPEEREIIIVDDGSDLSPMNDLLRYGDDIIYVRQKNGGLSTARNKGIEVATGNYLQFVDGDDQLIQSGYDNCLDILRRHQDADMVLFDFDEHTCPEQADTAENPTPMSGTSYMRHHNIHGTAWGYLFRRTTLSDLRFTPGIYHEDEEFTPQLLIRAETVYPTMAKAYCYNRRPDSIITSQDEAHIEKRFNDMLQVIRHLHQMADRLPNNDQLAMERRVAQLTMDYIHNVIRQTRSLTITRQRIETLRAEGLFPLPDRNYTKKYQWFRRMTNSRLGLGVLVRLLPLMKKER
jgi:hypothetical protein